MRSKMREIIQPSRWRLPQTTRRNRPSSGSSCSDWQACYGASVGRPPSKVGCSEIQAQRLLQFRQRRQAREDRQATIGTLLRNAVTPGAGTQSQEPANSDADGSISLTAPAGDIDDLTRSFVRLSKLPTYPLDRLARYEGTLWRQACQILFALQFLGQPWERITPRMR